MFHCFLYVYLCVCVIPLQPLKYTATSMPEFKMEIVAFFFFNDNLEHFFYFVIGLSCNGKKPKAHQAHSAVTYCTVHINHFTSLTVVMFFFTKCHFTASPLCQYCSQTFVLFFFFAQVAHFFFFFCLCLSLKLPPYFMLFRYCENCLGKRKWLGINATVWLCLLEV